MQSAVHLALCPTEQMQICHHSMRRVFFNQIRVQAFFPTLFGVCARTVLAESASNYAISSEWIKRGKKNLARPSCNMGNAHTQHTVLIVEKRKKVAHWKQMDWEAEQNIWSVF